MAVSVVELVLVKEVLVVAAAVVEVEVVCGIVVVDVYSIMKQQINKW